MKAFAAACLISVSYAFSLDAGQGLQDPKNILKGIPQLESAPAFDKAEGF